MKRLESRNYDSAEAFVQDFLETLQSGIIPRVSFIPWTHIDRKLLEFGPAIDAFEALVKSADGGAIQPEKLSEALLSSPNPTLLVRCAFNLLGHTGDSFVSAEDDISVVDAAAAIKRGDRALTNELVQLLKEVGFFRILSAGHLYETLCGVLVGLGPNSRKSIGGASFNKAVCDKLREMIPIVSGTTGRKLRLSTEQKIVFPMASKHVDFAIIETNRILIAGELNFYTVTGSKPSEIVRSYRDVYSALTAQQIVMVWITDGIGWKGMRPALLDAYNNFPNIYNFSQLRSFLATDIIGALT